MLFPFTFTIFSSMNNVFPHKSKSSCPIKCSSRRFRFTQTYKNCFSAVTNVTRKCLNITSYRLSYCRSQWPRGLRLRSAAARLLRSWVRIPPGAWIFVCCECCVLSRTGLCNELITRLEESYRQWCVVVCDLEISWMRRPWPALGHSATERKKFGRTSLVRTTCWMNKCARTCIGVWLMTLSGYVAFACLHLLLYIYIKACLLVFPANYIRILVRHFLMITPLPRM